MLASPLPPEAGTEIRTRAGNLVDLRSQHSGPWVIPPVSKLYLVTNDTVSHYNEVCWCTDFDSIFLYFSKGNHTHFTNKNIYMFFSRL